MQIMSLYNFEDQYYSYCPDCFYVSLIIHTFSHFKSTLKWILVFPGVWLAPGRTEGFTAGQTGMGRGRVAALCQQMSLRDKHLCLPPLDVS